MTSPARIAVKACTALIDAAALPVAAGKDQELFLSLMTRARAYQRLGRPELALRDYRTAVKVDASDDSVWFEISSLEWRRGDLKAALDAVNMAIKNNSSAAGYHWQKGRLLAELGRTVHARSSFRKSLLLRPNNARALNSLGITFLKQQRYRSALERFNLAIKIDPSDMFFYYNRGKAYSGLERHAEALADYRRTAKMAPKDPDTWGNVGLTLLWLGRFAEALPPLERALALGWDKSETQRHRAYALMGLKRNSEALVAAEVSARLEKNNAWRVVVFADALCRNRRAGEAIAKFAEARKIGRGKTTVPIIRNKQRIMKKSRHYSGPISGRFDSSTRAAFERWVRDGCPGHLY